jgi:hypothetical protein
MTGISVTNNRFGGIPVHLPDHHPPDRARRNSGNVFDDTGLRSPGRSNND